MTKDEPQYLELAFLCDAAHEKNGNLSALGIGINMFGVPALPAVVNMTLVIRLSLLAETLDEGERGLSVRFVGPDGAENVRIAGAFSLGNEGPRDPDLPTGANLVFPVPVPVTLAGLHHVEIEIDGRTYPSIPFKVFVGVPAL